MTNKSVSVSVYNKLTECECAEGILIGQKVKSIFIKKSYAFSKIICSFFTILFSYFMLCFALNSSFLYIKLLIDKGD